MGPALNLVRRSRLNLVKQPLLNLVKRPSLDSSPHQPPFLARPLPPPRQAELCFLQPRPYLPGLIPSPETPASPTSSFQFFVQFSFQPSVLSPASLISSTRRRR